jgi:hypothetical protein
MRKALEEVPGQYQLLAVAQFIIAVILGGGNEVKIPAMITILREYANS